MSELECELLSWRRFPGTAGSGRGNEAQRDVTGGLVASFTTFLNRRTQREQRTSVPRTLLYLLPPVPILMAPSRIRAVGVDHEIAFLHVDANWLSGSVVLLVIHAELAVGRSWIRTVESGLSVTATIWCGADDCWP